MNAIRSDCLVVGVRDDGAEAVHLLLAVEQAPKFVDDGDEPVAGLPAAGAVACRRHVLITSRRSGSTDILHAKDSIASLCAWTPSSACNAVQGLGPRRQYAAS